MDYIVFDLEWNQCPYGKEQENERLPFEIIEIGAIKLNEQKERIDEFHQIIHPVVYRKIHFRTREIIGMDMAELDKGEYFQQAVCNFLRWCGDDYAFCTWGTLDVMELQRNLKYYGLLAFVEGPVYYYDVQKLFAVQYETRHERRSLEYAVDYLGLEKAGEFHLALEDARYTAMVLQNIQDGCIHGNCSIDCYQNPKLKEDEIHILYEDYEKYVSREFDTKEDAMRDREVTSMHCVLCRKNAKRKLKWFSNNAKLHFAVAYCPRHGYLKGKIRIKKTEDDKFFAIKTVKLISEEEALFIRDKQSAIRKKRQRKRHEKV